MAGADPEKSFIHAEKQKSMEIRASVFWSSQVSQLLPLVYAFKNCESGSLFNTEGLTASSLERIGLGGVKPGFILI